MAKLTIDGIPVEVPDGTVLLEACKAIGIDVPNFCYYPKIALLGACRMCLVEIKAGPLPPAALAKPQASCTTTVRGDGWEVLTNSPKVEKLRKGILEFLLLNHSLTCPTCDMGGECELQDTTWRYGPGISRMQDPKAFRKITSLGPFVDLNMQRCVQCQRCTRYCDEVMGNRAISMENRGASTQVMGFPGEDLDCVLCGNCIEVCPVGALTSDQFDAKARQWDRIETTTVCTYCSDGCSMKLDVKAPAGTNNTPILENVVDRYSLKLYKDRGRALRARAFIDSGILIEEYKGNNEEFLCHKGRFGFHVINHPERLATPLVRRDGTLQPATWQEALQAVAEGFNRILNANGPDALGGIGSEKTTNEESYLFQKFIRTVFGTNNVDHRLNAKDLRTETAPGSKQFTVNDLFNSRSILLIGAGVTEENPLTESRIRLAVRRNRASLVVGGSRRSLIADETPFFARCKPGAEAALAYALAAALVPAREAALKADAERTQAALDPAALERATQGGRVPLEVVTKTAQDAADRAKAALAAYSVPSDLKKIFDQLPLEKSAELAGVAADRIQAAAKTIAGSPATHVVLGQDLMKAPGGREAVALLRALCRAFGWPDAAELLEHNNTRGARDVGMLPDLLPGYRPVSDAAAREALSEAWGAPISGKAGLNTHQMFQAAATGQIKGLYLMGANPLVTYAGGDLAQRAVEKLEFLVVQDVFLTETAQRAHVVLPAALFAEKEGTFTNWEGRVQRVRPAVAPPGEARPDDEIITDVAREMGKPWRTNSYERVLQEIGQAGGIYAGISQANLETVKGEGVLWPRVNGGGDLPIPLSVPDFSDLKADADYPYILFWGNDVYHHGSLTSWDEGPRTAEAQAYVEVNPADARKLGVVEGDGVVVQTAREKIELPCRVTDDVAPGQVFTPTTFPETPTNRLLDSGRILERARLSKGTPQLAPKKTRVQDSKAGVAG
jgi:predicted molibdopterin-dependent oxidoreductase YjgC